MTSKEKKPYKLSENEKDNLRKDSRKSLEAMREVHKGKASKDKK